MLVASAKAHATLIRTTSNKLGTALPDAFDKALTEAQALREATELIEGSAAAVNQGIINSLRQGKDWRTDKHVQALMFERVAAANGIRQAGVEAADESVTEALTDQADNIIAAWADALAPDAKTLATAAARLDVADLDPGTVNMHELNRRKLVGVWADASAAAERFKTGLDGWRAVATATHLQWQRQHEGLILADAPQDVIDAARTTNRVTAWSLVRAGADLQLATLTDYMQRVSRYVAAQQQRQRNQDAKHQRSGLTATVL